MTQRAATTATTPAAPAHAPSSSVPGAAAGVADVQRRLQLVLASQHGPTAAAAWSQACTRAGVLCTGPLLPAELERVADVLAAGTGAVAVAARTCRVRLLFLLRAAQASAPAAPGAFRPAAVPASRLLDADVREVLRVPGALDLPSFRTRLAELARR